MDARGTTFQMRVWRALTRIPFGNTISYGQLAENLNSSPRAVGNANGKNPIPIIIPCHRVIGADGTLCGFGGGLDKKQALLNLEGARFLPVANQAALTLE
jgi:methylated-DNA-[protein]-cysteine S-methyltransferase